VQKKVWL